MCIDIIWVAVWSPAFDSDILLYGSDRVIRATQMSAVVTLIGLFAKVCESGRMGNFCAVP